MKITIIELNRNQYLQRKQLRWKGKNWYFFTFETNNGSAKKNCCRCQPTQQQTSQLDVVPSGIHEYLKMSKTYGSNHWNCHFVPNILRRSKWLSLLVALVYLTTRDSDVTFLDNLVEGLYRADREIRSSHTKKRRHDVSFLTSNRLAPHEVLFEYRIGRLFIIVLFL